MPFSAFYAGLTGLKTNAAALNVIGNNLANVNTVGFKVGRANFAELFSAGGGGIGVNRAGTPMQVGLGAQLSGVQQLFSQGALQPTDVVTDLAIQGRGLFVLNDRSGGAVYSRAGNFSFDAEGFLVDPNGYRLQGYQDKDANGRIVSSGTYGDIQIPAGMTASPRPTSYFRPEMNLNAGATPDDPLTAENEGDTPFSTGITVYDSKGGPHDVTLVLTPEDTSSPLDGAIDQWSYEVRIDRSELSGITTNPDDPPYYVVDSGALTFDGSGNLATPTSNPSLTIPGWANGASAQTITWELFDPSGTPQVSSVVAPSAVSSLTQDGAAQGLIRALAIDAEGIVSGVFSNGETIQLSQLVVATFNNPGGLLKAGQNVYTSSIASGPPTQGTANSGARGSISAQSLELSNVEITDQFTDMIVVERGYQSNSRVIRTVDNLTQEALTLIR